MEKERFCCCKCTILLVGCGYVDLAIELLALRSDTAVAAPILFYFLGSFNFIFLLSQL